MTQLNLNNLRSPKTLRAWSVHLFTATGAVWGLMAIIAVIQHQWQAAFFWMGAAVVVDSVDGTLARRFEVKGMLPDFDGALLDNIIDYLTYVLVPALFVYEAGLVPDALALFSAVVMVLTSAYQFCQADAKTEDNFFKGFPSYWNIIVFYLFLLQTGPWVNLAVILLCAILIFVPTKYAYPSRMSRFQKLTLSLTVIWAVMMLVALWQHPALSWLVWLSLIYVVYYVAISFYLSRLPVGG
ncbi:MAG: CDP-alcohol phosphatidyltransferase family protein [Chloroflexota bacterium]|jgi:phosphatidylcholine synthase